MDREEILKILSTYNLTEAEKEYFYLKLYFTDQLNNKGDKKIQEFHEEQKENRDSILSEIAKIMLSYHITESIMSIGSSDKIKLKRELNTLLQNKIQSEINSETLKTKDLLESIGKDKYNINNYINDIGMNVNSGIKPVEDETLANIINGKVENKTWTDRLWDNKNDLQKNLKAQIDSFLNGKTTVNEIEENIKKKYNSNAYETKRLVLTEIARVQEEMNQAWAKEHGVKYQMFMATLDFKTSQVCRGFDTKVFEFNDVNKPIPPLHPFCRSTLVNLPNKDWRPSERLDNETKKNISWQSYEEWLNKQKQTGGKFTRGDVAWDDRRNTESEDYYNLIRNRQDDVKIISKNTGFPEKMIDQIKKHVFYNDKHILYGGEMGLLAPDYDMSVAWQRLINGEFEKRDILLLKHEYLESGMEKRYNLTNRQAHDITTRKYDWWSKLVSEKGEFGEDDCLIEIVGTK